jgi:hypothetical protein
MRPELGIDSDDFARAAAGVVTASRPTMKPRFADLGHLLERRVGRLIRVLGERIRHGERGFLEADAVLREVLAALAWCSTLPPAISGFQVTFAMLVTG